MSNETPQKELTREELYEKVWSTPGTKLAEELGISDVAITKRCTCPVSLLAEIPRTMIK
jgi:biotin operon repressor